MSDLRCTCGAWEEVEKALVKLSNFNCESRHEMKLDGVESANIIWDFLAGELRLQNNYGAIFHSVRVKYTCDLPGCVISLAEVAEPPAPKEREWLGGDELQDEKGRRAIVVGMKINAMSLSILTFVIIGNSPPIHIEAYVKEMKEHWRNLTIEAEQAGEK
ncbi:hypothetical protein LCGC14_1896220 [marine sediment metagenome]|uniref:Uncharacterized protein n=1 Tax=marine sediment metagenome TaxID=412755 RepID=A0A0F9FY93_9ZZZZ